MQTADLGNLDHFSHHMGGWGREATTTAGGDRFACRFGKVARRRR
jgi:hypothetical protein